MTEPLRILLAVEPGIDGVFRCVEPLARHLLAHGVEVHLAYSSQRSGPALFELVKDVAAAGGKTLDLRVGNGPGPGDALALARLWRLVRATRPHVIHGHSSKAGALVRLLRLTGVGAPIFYTPHAYYQMHQPLGPKGRVLMGIERLLGGVGVTMHVSRSEQAYGRQLLHLAPERQIVNNNGIDCLHFHPVDPAGRARLRRELGWPADALVLGTVARYSRQKDPQTLYRAVFAALEAEPGLHFAHLGSGDLRPEIDALVAANPHRSRIHQMAGLADPHTFYQALDGFVLPSRYEGLALSALEALATGLPMILTDCPGNDDLKDYDLNAIRWVQPGDSSGLASAIIAWAREAAAGTPTNHRETALRAFHAENSCRCILGVYESVAKRR